MSVINFENITEDLTENELEYLPNVVDAIKFRLTDIGEPVKQNILANYINNWLKDKHGIFCKIEMNTVRLRKYFNHIRVNGMLPIIATSSGCYIATNKQDIEKQIHSLEQRARSIQKAADGLKKFL